MCIFTHSAILPGPSDVHEPQNRKSTNKGARNDDSGKNLVGVNLLMRLHITSTRFGSNESEMGGIMVSLSGRGCG